MALKSWMAGSAVLFALTTMAATAQAGPVGGTARELAAAGTTGSQLQQVANRVCWRENGMRRCRSLNNVLSSAGLLWCWSTDWLRRLWVPRSDRD
jgi:hypothetical protein